MKLPWNTPFTECLKGATAVSLTRTLLQNYPISGKITKSYQIHGMYPNRDLKSPLHLSLSIHKVFLLFLPQMVVSQLNLKIK